MVGKGERSGKLGSEVASTVFRNSNRGEVGP